MFIVGSIPAVVRHIFQLARCGYVRLCNLLHIKEALKGLQIVFPLENNKSINNGGSKSSTKTCPMYINWIVTLIYAN